MSETVQRLSDLRDEIENLSNEGTKIRADLKLKKKQYQRLFNNHVDEATAAGFESLVKDKDED